MKHPVSARHPLVDITRRDVEWRLTADGTTLEAFRNGVSQFTYTTDGSYPAGDVGMEALSPAFTFVAWTGVATAAPVLRKVVRDTYFWP